MSNKYWTDKADNADEILAADFNAAFDAIEADIAAKVDKESGKGLSGNDYTDGDKAEVGKIANKADADKVYTKAEALNKLCPKHSASGYPIIVSDQLADIGLKQYKIFGNSVQNGTADNVQSVGDLVTDTSSGHYGKYDIPILINGKNFFNKDLCNEDFIKNEMATSSVTYYGINLGKKLLSTLTPNTTYRVSADIECVDIPSSEYQITSKYIGFVGLHTEGNYKDIYCGGSDTTLEAGKTYHFLNTFTTPVDFDKGKYTLLVYWGYSRDSDGKQHLPTVVWRNIQFELGTAKTSFEPYESKTEHIYLDEPLRKTGDYADYIDFENKKVIRQTDESLGVLPTPTEENITVPALTLFDSEKTSIFIKTTVEPSKLDITYYQDINKVIANLTNAILAQGGNT